MHGSKFAVESCLHQKIVVPICCSRGLHGGCPLHLLEWRCTMCVACASLWMQFGLHGVPMYCTIFLQWDLDVFSRALVILDMVRNVWPCPATLHNLDCNFLLLLVGIE